MSFFAFMKWATPSIDGYVQQSMISYTPTAQLSSIRFSSLHMQVEELQNQLQQKLLGSQAACTDANPMPRPDPHDSPTDSGRWGPESDATSSYWAGVGSRARVLAVPAWQRGNGRSGSLSFANNRLGRLKGSVMLNRYRNMNFRM